MAALPTRMASFPKPPEVTFFGRHLGNRIVSGSRILLPFLRQSERHAHYAEPQAQKQGHNQRDWQLRAEIQLFSGHRHVITSLQMRGVGKRKVLGHFVGDIANLVACITELFELGRD